MVAVAERLARVGLFAEFSAKQLDDVAKRCQQRNYAGGQQIVGHLDETNDVYFILSGRVRVNMYSPAGKVVSFRDIDAGETFGELAAIDGLPRSANVVALQDAAIASMSAKAFWEVLMSHPEAASLTLRRLASLVRLMTERVFEISALAVRNRVQSELLRLARHGLERDNTSVISPAPTHADIASRVSTHREAVTRELNDLARAGLVARQSGALVVLDVARLAQMVEDVLDE